MSFYSNWSGGTLSITTDNVVIKEDITQIIYGKTPEGKTDFKTRVGKELDPNTLQMFASTLEDMINYTDKEFDSRSLIGSLFSKLPRGIVGEFLKELNDAFE